ncbi:UNVERIFIED_CONTAM: hypothetical protein GTU68_065799 [Idotea baltica]|nr:hypothetical protein [Idotea baltica]
MTHLNLQGFIPAPFTCFSEDGTINVKPIAAYAQLLKNKGAVGAFILGTTGEGVTMTIAERKQVAEEWIKHQSNSFQVIVHVGGPSITSSLELARHACEIGAAAISLMAPIFFRPASVQALVEYVSSVAQECPKLPVYFYHIPSMTDVNLSMPEFLHEADERIPNLAGIKFTHHDMMEYNECIMYGDGKYHVMHGFDEVLLCGLALGVKAAVGSTYNYFLPPYLRLKAAFESGDLDNARELQAVSVQLVRILMKYGGGLTAGKAIMSFVGVDCGPCRMPTPSLSLNQRREMRADLEKMDFFSLC